MRVIQAHNFYAEPGGEDRVVEREAKLLVDKGVDLIKLYFRNPTHPGLLDYAQAGRNSIWNGRVEEMIENVSPRKDDILHLHNWFPHFSPAVLYFAKEAGMKTVMTMHNFRALHSGGVIWASNDDCESSKSLFSLRSAWEFLTVSFHKHFGLWHRWTDKFICPSQYVADILSERGFDPTKLVVKPHFCFSEHYDFEGNSEQYALFVGRSGTEKGLNLLLEIWKHIDFPLVVVGETQSSAVKNVTFTGPLPEESLSGCYRAASFVVIPSLVHETFCNVVMEAFCHKVPVIAFKVGALSESITDNTNGLLVEPYNQSQLASAIQTLIGNFKLRKRLSVGAAETFEQLFTPQRNFQLLKSIYQSVL